MCGEGLLCSVTCPRTNPDLGADCPSGQSIVIRYDDLHCSLGHADDAVLRDTARQVSIKVAGRFGYCVGCAGGKGIRNAITKSTSWRAEKQLQRLYADLAGPMPTSTGGTQYCLMTVDDATNMGHPAVQERGHAYPRSAVSWRPFTPPGS